MKVITLLSSARGKKSNTGTVLTWVEEGLKTLGHEVERIHLNKLSLAGCLGCAKCREKPHEPACVQKDDISAVIDKLISAQAAIYASPLYFWGFSAPMKIFIDRCYCLVTNYGKPSHTSLVEGQRQALLVTAADGYEDNGEEIVTTFRRIVDYNKAVLAGELFVGECTTPDDLGEKEKERAKVLARQIAGEMEYKI